MNDQVDQEMDDQRVVVQRVVDLEALDLLRVAHLHRVRLVHVPEIVHHVPEIVHHVPEIDKKNDAQVAAVVTTVRVQLEMFQMVAQ
jgi:hypothetical protein